MRTREGQGNRLRLGSALAHRALKIVRRSLFMPSELPYNLTVSDTHRFIWFRVAKVCTRTIYRQLQNSGVRLDIEHAMRMHYPVNRYAQYFKFAFVRNPWDRLVSCYENKVVARGTAHRSQRAGFFGTV